jgi:hypothetical protein
LFQKKSNGLFACLTGRQKGKKEKERSALRFALFPAFLFLEGKIY